MRPYKSLAAYYNVPGIADDQMVLMTPDRPLAVVDYLVIDGKSAEAGHYHWQYCEMAIIIGNEAVGASVHQDALEPGSFE